MADVKGLLSAWLQEHAGEQGVFTRPESPARVLQDTQDPAGAVLAGREPATGYDTWSPRAVGTTSRADDYVGAFADDVPYGVGPYHGALKGLKSQAKAPSYLIAGHGGWKYATRGPEWMVAGRKLVDYADDLKKAMAMRGEQQARRPGPWDGADKAPEIDIRSCNLAGGGGLAAKLLCDKAGVEPSAVRMVPPGTPYYAGDPRPAWSFGDKPGELVPQTPKDTKHARSIIRGWMPTKDNPGVGARGLFERNTTLGDMLSAVMLAYERNSAKVNHIVGKEFDQVMAKLKAHAALAMAMVKGKKEA